MKRAQGLLLLASMLTAIACGRTSLDRTIPDGQTPMPVPVAVAPIAPLVFPTGLAVANGALFVSGQLWNTDPSPGIIATVPVTGGSLSTVVVMSVPLAGGSPTTVAKRQVNPLAIAVDEHRICWANYGTLAKHGADGAILSLAK